MVKKAKKRKSAPFAFNVKLLLWRPFTDAKTKPPATNLTVSHLVEDAAETPDVASAALLDDRHLSACGRVDVPFPRVFESLGAHVVHRAELSSRAWAR